MDNADITKLFEIKPPEFEERALSIFQFQYTHNELFNRYTDLVTSALPVTALEQIPFLPISFFKTHEVRTTPFEEAMVFQSSGTTGNTTSRHLVKDPSIYRHSCQKAFERLYGPIEDYCILALLPSYLERGHSSLVYMVQGFMDQSRHPLNGFYLQNGEQLHQTLVRLEAMGQKTLLVGVTYALLDFAAAYPLPLQHTIVMETGGMKGRKKEMLRQEVHMNLMRAFGVERIHSEYGMTELLSQAYAQEGGRFVTPPWMKVLIGEEDDPGKLITSVSAPTTGVLHVIDLANIFSCCFIATEDIGRLHPDGSFEVLGRMDHTDVRGCSLLAV